jgi:hypothetical protein
LRSEFVATRCTQYQVTTEGEELQEVFGTDDEAHDKAMGDIGLVIKESCSFDLLGLEIANTSCSHCFALCCEAGFAMFSAID